MTAGAFEPSREAAERQRWERMVRAITEGTAATSGGEFFAALVENLARALDVRYAFVAECGVGSPQRAVSRAYWTGDGLGENFEYDIPGTPCQQVLNGQACVFTTNLQALFPEEKELVEMHIDSYIGVPLRNARSAVIGHIAVLDCKPMQSGELGASVMQLFAGRAAAELERLKARERERALLELNNSIITALTMPELLNATCAALSRVIHFDRAAIAIFETEIDDLRVYALKGAIAPDQLALGHRLSTGGGDGVEPFDYTRPLKRGDLERERRYGFDAGLLAAGIRSHCALPLTAGGKTIGILGIGSKERNRYSDEDFEFLQEVASQIALAVANTRAYEEIRMLKTRLQEENVYLRRELIANVSHDLRSPLASLQGYLETLLLKDDLPADKRRSYIELAARQSEHLGTLIAELFELAKLDFKGYQIDPELVHLGELAQDLVQKFHLAAEGRGVALRAAIDAGAGRVSADVGLIERALTNLIENALHHTGKGGEITVAVEALPDRVRVRVADTGSGIPADELPFIFERFYQVRKSRPSRRGAGLGLAIVRRVVELHGSRIEVASGEGRGTAFSFELLRGDCAPPSQSG